MKKKGLLRISAGMAAIILGGATLAGCGDDVPVIDNNVDTSIAKIINKEALLEEWGVNSGSRSIQLTQSLAKIRTDGHTITFTSSDETVATIDDAGKITPVAAGTVTFTVKLDSAIADSIEVTLVASSYQSLEAVTKAILESNGDVTPVYFFKGVVTQIIATKAFTIQEGDYAIYIYANPKTICEGHEIAVGDVVGVTSHAQLYNGLIETKTETTVTYLPDETAETITAKTVQNKDLTDALQSVLVNVNGLKPVGSYTSATSSVYGELQVTDDTSESRVTVYVNKYLPAETLEAINTKLNKLANEAFTANLKGVVVSKYNDFQYLITDPEQIELVAAAAVNPTSVTISNENDVKQLIVGKTAKLAFTFAPENCNAKALTFVSSDPTVATVDTEGNVKALKVGTTKITATSTVVDTVKAELDVTVIAPKFVTAPIAGEEYLMGVECADGALCYINGEMQNTYYGKTVAGKEDGLKAVIEKGTGENEGKFAIKLSNGKYIDITVSGEHNNYVYADAAAYFSYDATNFCYYKTIENVKYYFGASGTYKTISPSKDKAADHPLRVYPVYSADAPVVGSSIKLGGYHYNLTAPKYLYLDGTLDDTYFKTGEGAENGGVFTVEEGTAEGRYALKTAAGKYIAREEQTNDKGSKFFACTLADAKSEATDFIWNTANMTYETIGVNPGTCLGTNGAKTYTTIGYSKQEYTNMVWMHAYVVDAPKAHGQSETDPLTVAEALEIAGALGDGKTTADVYYIQGKVAKIESPFNLGNGNISVWVTDDGAESANMFEFYKLTGLKGAKLMHASDIEVGDTVVTKSTIKKYVNNDKTKTILETGDSTVPTVSITKANAAARAVAFDKASAKVAFNKSVTIKAGVAPTTIARDASKITWSVDDTKGTLSATTGGEVTFTSKEVAGDVTITASWKENDEATPVTGTFVVTVEEITPVMNLVFDGTTEPTTKGDAKVEYTNANGCKFTVEKVGDSTAAGGVGQAYLGSSSAAEIRLYAKQKITFSQPEGKTISYIEVVVTNTQANFTGSTFTNGAAELISGTGNASSSNKLTYKITPTDGTASVSYVAKGAHRFASIKIVLVSL